jgi:hypothetical protein
MVITLQRNIRSWSLLSLIVLSGLAACAPKGPELPGRFLLLENMGICGVDGQFTLYEYKAGMESPAPLWTEIPCSPNHVFSSIARSFDNHYYMFISDAPPARMVLVDLVTGEFKNLPLPDDDLSEALRIRGDFSPNNQYFVYSVDNPNNHSIIPRVYLMDLATGTNSILFESPCAEYSEHANVFYSTRICASMGSPQWLDETTLVFIGYSGEMPITVVWGVEDVEVDPNQTFVMDVVGTILHQFTPALYISGITGPTVLYYEYGKGEEGYKWMETNDLKLGEVKPHLLDVSSQFTDGHVGDSGYLQDVRISPDGQFVFQKIDGDWHQIGLRSDSDTKLSYSLDDCSLWSPDREYIVCGLAQPRIMSLEGFADQKFSYPEFYVPIAWLP